MAGLCEGGNEPPGSLKATSFTFEDAANQRIPNLNGPVDINDVTLQRNRNKTAGRFNDQHGSCTSCCPYYASKILRNFRTVISFKEKRA
ncbi:hypothetical protein ANN_22136 [Periplaneta americana]|uniref:Uncharacterized protein n=1 Tax=Periplaneta americana TaxID=6978 RepID=A0ABQ8S7N2_PERAM|nr:hypothetical protein ANN_22136 [Periplaneta americana]